MKYYLLVFFVIVLIITIFLIPGRSIEKKYEGIQRDPPASMNENKGLFGITLAEALGYVKTVFIVNGGNERQIKTSILASEISGNDKGFVALLLAENGMMTPDRISLPNSDGTRDHGFCQMNDNPNHKKINVIKDPRFLTDEKWQMEKCYMLYKGGTTFYAKPRSEKFLKEGRIIKKTI